MNAMQALSTPIALNTKSTSKPLVATDWHALDADSVTSLLNVDAVVGLTSSQVTQRQLRYGPNALQRIQSRPAWRVLIDQFANIVIALLAFAAAVSWATGDHAEAIAILVVLILNAAVGFATEWQAGRALEALRRQSRTVSRVRRDGFEVTLDAEELVPGDIIILNAGDRVPADARLLSSVPFEVEESALTGESTPVEKRVSAVSSTASIAERHSMIFLGTGVATGRAEAVVVDTGPATE